MPPTAAERAAVLAVGDELTTGQSLDTNSRWVAERLGALGCTVVEHVTVADDRAAIAAAMSRLAEAAGVLIVTGGLGPTQDDLTREALADALGDRLVEDADMASQVRRRFDAAGVAMPASNRVQALRPESAAGLANEVGTAPGLRAALRRGGSACEVFCLPGPPAEMAPMFERFVAPALASGTSGGGGRVVRALVLHMYGIGESAAAERLGSLMDRKRNPLVGTTASGGQVSVRIRHEGAAAEADRLVGETERLVRDAVGEFVFGRDEETLASAALAALKRRGETVVTVESCTGGLLGALITEVSGSSAVYLGGWVTYANEAKMEEVGVPEALLKAHGAVSEEVARAMAEGALRTSLGARAQHALAITGIAGPEGGTPDKPVGTVWIARAGRGGGGGGGSGGAANSIETDARLFQFAGDRQAVRMRSALTALEMLRRRVLRAGTGSLLLGQRRGRT